MKKSVIRQRFFEKQQRKHVWLGILCSVCMVLSLVLAIPVTALAGEGETSTGTEITSIEITGVSFDLDSNTDVTFGTVAADAPYTISEQRWDDAVDNNAIGTESSNMKPTAGHSYYYTATMKAKDGYYFSNNADYYKQDNIIIKDQNSNSNSISITWAQVITKSGEQVLQFKTDNIMVPDNGSQGGSGTEGEGSDAGTGGPSGNNSSNSNNSSTSNSAPHTHSFAWCTITEPTAEQDGLEAYACTSCGYYEESVPVSAYSYACHGGAKQVISAAQGSELTLDMGVWCAYPKWFMQKIADRRDLTIRLLFEYEHKQYEVIIPAGAAVDTQCDWYGPLKLCSLYSYTAK